MTKPFETIMDLESIRGGAAAPPIRVLVAKGLSRSTLDRLVRTRDGRPLLINGRRVAG